MLTHFSKQKHTDGCPELTVYIKQIQEKVITSDFFSFFGDFYFALKFTNLKYC